MNRRVNVRRSWEDPRTGALRLAALAGAAGSTDSARRRILATGPVTFTEEDAGQGGFRSLTTQPREGDRGLATTGSLAGPGGPLVGPTTGIPVPADPAVATPVAGAALDSILGLGVGAGGAAVSEAVGMGAATTATVAAAGTTGGQVLTSRRRSRQGPMTEPLPAAVEPERTERAPSGRAGRNLPAAIGVGLLLAGAVLASLLFRKEAFVGLVCGAVVLAVWEISSVLAGRRIHIPVVPIAVGSLGMLVSAFVAREEGLLVAFTLTAFGVLLWRLIDGVDGAVNDVAAGTFTAAYVPFLAGFAMIMLAEPDGARRVLLFIGVTVASDIGGYVAGVLFGRHPMAPAISPKKSWEGFAGSLVTCTVVGVAGVVLLLQGPWWAGCAVGAAAAVTATLGDLSESMLKRDLGVKDMGNLLPGHGGMMDRLDSLLPTAPAVYLMLTLLVPVAG